MNAFEPTQPQQGSPRQQHGDFAPGDRCSLGSLRLGQTRLAGLGPALLDDLQRHPAGEPRAALDVLQVLAAALRQARALQLQLQVDERIVPLQVWPRLHQVRCPLRADALLALRLSDLRVLQVQAVDDGDAATAAVVPPRHEPALLPSPLPPLLWQLALRGPRSALLPEIVGPAVYRTAPGAELAGLALNGLLAAAVARLQAQAVPLREIAAWPGFDADRAQRLLNALYLQAGLMVSRSHPKAAG